MKNNFVKGKATAIASQIKCMAGGLEEQDKKILAQWRDTYFQLLRNKDTTPDDHGNCMCHYTLYLAICARAVLKFKHNMTAGQTTELHDMIKSVKIFNVSFL